jgi:hypothetical protein
MPVKLLYPGSLSLEINPDKRDGLRELIIIDI